MTRYRSSSCAMEAVQVYDVIFFALPLRPNFFHDYLRRGSFHVPFWFCGVSSERKFCSHNEALSAIIEPKVRHPKQFTSDRIYIYACIYITMWSGLTLTILEREYISSSTDARASVYALPRKSHQGDYGLRASSSVGIRLRTAARAAQTRGKLYRLDRRVVTEDSAEQVRRNPRRAPPRVD